MEVEKNENFESTNKMTLEILKKDKEIKISLKQRILAFLFKRFL